MRKTHLISLACASAGHTSNHVPSYVLHTPSIFPHTEQSNRMSEAKVEADKIVQTYRSDLEAKYNAAHSVIQGNAGAEVSELNAKTAVDIAAMQGDFSSKKKAVADSLVDLVCKVEYTVRPARR